MRRVLIALMLVAGALQWGPAPVQAATPDGARTTRPDIAAGSSHSCMLIADGTVKCWGLNTSGQLGDQTLVLRKAPVAVKAAATGATLLAKVTAIAVGDAHSCALISDGTVKCWGENGSGQLGNMSATNLDSKFPVAVHTSSVSAAPLSNVRAIALGGAHSCALLANGTVKCWGLNTFGQLGDGTAVIKKAPVSVRTSSATATPLAGVAAIDAGTGHSCALLAAGTLRCWGLNASGQLGDATLVARSSPVVVRTSATVATALPTVTAISAGGSHSCALLAVGTVRCWGLNTSGQLGDATLVARSSPVVVRTSAAVATALPNVKAISTGSSHSCALLVGGTEKCWGLNTSGQLGDATLAPRSSPVAVLGGLTNVRSIALGASHSCAFLATGTPKCWGENGSGQLGNNSATNADATTPVAVSLIVASTKPVALASGWYHTCALLANGTMKCWGDNVNGQIGNNNAPNDASSAVAVTGITNAIAITAGSNHTCALLATGAVNCWGYGFFGQLGNNVVAANSASPVAVKNVANTANLAGVVGISAGDNHTCAVLATGQANCWGLGSAGQLGGGSTSDSALPVVVRNATNTAPLAGVVKMSEGGGHSCALIAAGTVACWGSNAVGQLGDGLGTLVDKSLPSTVRNPTNTASLTGIREISADAAGNCVIEVGGVGRCWGFGTLGQLGDNNYTTASDYPATTVIWPSALVSLSSQSDHVCAVSVEGNPSCWGTDASGQLGMGFTVAGSAGQPVSIGVATTPLTDAVAISAGGQHSCALLIGGVVKCWGAGTDGQLGDGLTSALSTAFVTVANL